MTTSKFDKTAPPPFKLNLLQIKVMALHPVVRPHNALDVAEEGGDARVEARRFGGAPKARGDDAQDRVDAILDVHLPDERPAGIALAGVLLLLRVRRAQQGVDDAPFEGTNGAGLLRKGGVALVHRHQVEASAEEDFRAGAICGRRNQD